MIAKRIVANIAASDLGAVQAFYRDIFGLETIMDHSWIVTLASAAACRPELSLAIEGGSGTPVPDISIEVDDVEEALRRAEAAGHAIVYGPADEPWGVRRFYLRDPTGKLVNVLAHRPGDAS